MAFSFNVFFCITPRPVPYMAVMPANGKACILYMYCSKERLDFSCALFGPDGGLVANAPHIPVHLGAMQETVQYQVRLRFLHHGVISRNKSECCAYFFLI